MLCVVVFMLEWTQLCVVRAFDNVGVDVSSLLGSYAEDEGAAFFRNVGIC
jgi:hypothetical protein